jgi:hypothetical protein
MPLGLVSARQRVPYRQFKNYGPSMIRLAVALAPFA